MPVDIWRPPLIENTDASHRKLALAAAAALR
jgi:hypothetical protein